MELLVMAVLWVIVMTALGQALGTVDWRVRRSPKIGLRQIKKPKKTLRELLDDLPCGSCERGYNAPHLCDVPGHCPCDHKDLHPGLGLSASGVHGSRQTHGGAEVVGITPSPQFVPPKMNLDGPREEVHEFGSAEPVALLAENGAMYTRASDGKICEHGEGQRQEVDLRDGRRIAWFCTNCDAKGYYPWPEEV